MSMDEQANSALSTDPENLWRRANDLAGQGRLLDAVPLYLELSLLWPERAAVWSNLSIILSALERPEEARDYQLRALELQPDDPAGQYKLGQIHEQLGALDQAVQSYLAVVESDPGYMDAWNSLADLSLQNGELDLAKTYLRPVLELDPNDPAANFLAGNLMRRKGDDEAAARHLAIAYTATGDPACGNNLAVILSSVDRVDEAIEILQGLVQSHPGYLSDVSAPGTY
jgi:tetratricopeptide (TPR) repeat protein